MAKDSLQELAITLPGKDRDAVHVESVVGREALNEAYAFVVDAISAKPIGLDDMIGKAAKVEIRVVDEEAVVHGVVGAAETRDPTQNREFCYRFHIVPELAMLRHSSQNQIYGTQKDVTVVDIVKDELSDANKTGSKTASSRVARNLQHDMLAASSDYPKLDFVMQYRESDFDFICRMCEKFGIFFMFDHGGDREKVVFGDRKENFRKIAGRELGQDLPFRGSAQIRSRGDHAIRSFNAAYATQAGAVTLREYNEETPKVDLTVTESAAFAGQGVRVDYGENYRDASEGRFLAARRAEELATRRLQYRGESNIPIIRPGFFFKLVDHPIDDFEQLYVVTEVEHRITERTPLGFSSPDKEEEPYANRFTCVPFDAGYRPPLTTPRPIVSGYLLARIDAAGEGKRAEIDEYGRYRVQIVDEESGLGDGSASFYVRKIEPYGGADGRGAHSTLLKGTEVALGFLAGDPDRPVILGAMSNAEMNNTVTEDNQNVSHRTVSTSGIIHQICDGAA